MPLSLLAAVLISAPVLDTDLQSRLDQLVVDMEEARVEYRVPGMTLGVVKDGEIVLVKAFGERDLESGEPMTVDTLLPIGSSTKAFTATAIGMLVDDEKMDWDDPVQQHLPNLVLQVQSDDDEAQATIRDLLCHRTGFPRMGVLWAGAKASNDQIFEAASNAVPQAEFRETFLYNNIMYLAAGEASAAAAGQPWDELIETRILDPLEMDRTEVNSGDAVSSGRLSVGYMWNPDTESFDVQQFRYIDTCAPAGSICSTPEDMACWVQFQLNGGMVEDRPVISSESLGQTHAIHIQMMPNMDYALGWMLEEWKGREVVQHGGNIDGYSAMVAFMPEEDIGFCLLMNSMPTAMQEASKSMIWTALLLDSSSDDRVAVNDLDPYTGSYLANFASFSDAIMEVTAKNGTLYLDVPGQMNYELVPPVEGDEKWPFKMIDAIAVSFHPDDSGDINFMKMYQAGITFELPRKGSALPSGPFKEDEIDHLLGTYEHLNAPIVGRTDEIKLENGWLLINIPGQMSFKLLPPDEDGRFAFRDFEGLELSFSVTGSGSVETMTIYQSGMEFPGKRVGGPEPGESESPLPSIDDILAMRAANAGKPIGPGEAFSLKGKMWVPPAGVEGTFEFLVAAPDRYRLDSTFGPFGEVSVAIDGSYGAEVGDFYEDRLLEGTERELFFLGGPGLMGGSWEAMFDTLEVVGRSEVDGVQAIKIEAKSDDFDQPFVLHVNPDTGALRKADVWVYVPNLGPYPMQMFLDEPVEMGDITWPESWWSFSEDTGEVRFILESATRVDDLDKDTFRLKEIQGPKVKS